MTFLLGLWLGLSLGFLAGAAWAGRRLAASERAIQERPVVFWGLDLSREELDRRAVDALLRSL